MHATLDARLGDLLDEVFEASGDLLRGLWRRSHLPLKVQVQL